MLRTILRKMINNRGLSLLLAAGFTLVTALAGVIPLYTDGVLQKVLTADLETAQAEDNVFPGNYTIHGSFEYLEPGDRARAFTALRRNVREKLIPQIPLPLLSVSEQATIALSGARVAERTEEGRPGTNVYFRTMQGMEDHITLTHGKLYTDTVTDGTIEVIVTAHFLNDNGFFLDDVLTLSGPTALPFARARIVGVFDIRDARDTYWAKSPDLATIYISHRYFEREILDRASPLLQTAEWTAAYDYHALTLSALGPMLQALDSHRVLAERYRQSLSVEFRARPILERYGSREQQLRLTLMIIDVPVIILLFFFVSMITGLVVAGERTEIAVLKSRGKSTAQVFLMYLVESLALVFVALLLGPPLGLFLGTFMGASNGFLEFVRRAPLPLFLNPSTFLYAAAAAFCLVAARMAPTFRAARISIVELKQRTVRDDKPPLWKRLFLDLVLLALAAYGLYRYQSRETLLRLTGTGTLDLGIDPLLFLTSAFFILGAGLLVMRAYPFLVRLAYRAGRSRWSPVMYYALLRVGRTGGRGRSLMIFLIFSLAVGVFSAATARTLNRNVEDKVRYRLGADVVLQPVWTEEGSVTSRGSGPQGPPVGGTFSDQEVERYYSVSRNYREPSFTPYARLDGVRSATRVFTNTNGKAALGSDVVTGVTLQGIIPHEFGEVSWFRRDLLPHHWYEYLNLLADSPTALLVSRDFHTRFNLNAGDTLSFTWGNQGYIQGVIYAFVDYWPAFDPGSADGGEMNHLIVANLPFLQNSLAKEPYQVWLRKKPGFTDAQVYADIQKKNLAIGSAASQTQILAARKNDPLLKGVNATLTLGFLIIMAVCAAGFLIHWSLSLRTRTLQFGILRAMGLSQRRVLYMIVIEQLLMTGTAVLAGLGIGALACRLFVPALEMVFPDSAGAPPFRVIVLGSDTLKILALVLAVLALSFASLSWFIRRLKIGSALKLGED